MSAPEASVKQHVAVLGAGAWGTALACAATKHAPTVLWARDAELAHTIHTRHLNAGYLPAIQLPEMLVCTASLQQALAHAQRGNAPGLLILGVPLAGLRALCMQLADQLAQTPPRLAGIIYTCKGLEADSSQLPSEVALSALRKLSAVPTGVLSGPSFALEVARGLPVALTIASASTELRQAAIQALHGGNIRVYASNDVLGVEVGGALKNIMAIACGVGDGLGLGTNARAALITRGLAEMTRFGEALGAQAATFSGLTGLGDLVLTATGDLSRNRQVGLAIGQGRNSLRAKRGASAATSVILKNADQNAADAGGVISLLNERQREFHWDGWRRQDQIRFGTFLSANALKPVTDAKYLLFPIPNAALAVNPNLSQNPGY